MKYVIYRDSQVQNQSFSRPLSAWTAVFLYSSTGDAPDGPVVADIPAWATRQPGVRGALTRLTCGDTQCFFLQNIKSCRGGLLRLRQFRSGCVVDVTFNSRNTAVYVYSKNLHYSYTPIDSVVKIASGHPQRW